MARLPKIQREALIRLGEKDALDRQRGLGVMQGIPANTAGALIRRGFGDKGVRSNQGRQHTVYWLTSAGVDEYQKEKART